MADDGFGDLDAEISSVLQGGPERPPVAPLPVPKRSSPQPVTQDDLVPAMTFDERQHLINNEKTLVEKMGKCGGELLHVFGAAQLVTLSGDHVNGIVVIRLLRHSLFSQAKEGVSNTVTESTVQQQVVGTLYEVWGFYDSKVGGKIGRLCSFRPETVGSVISLKSDLFIEN